MERNCTGAGGNVETGGARQQVQQVWGFILEWVGISQLPLLVPGWGFYLFLKLPEHPVADFLRVCLNLLMKIVHSHNTPLVVVLHFLVVYSDQVVQLV